LVHVELVERATDRHTLRDPRVSPEERPKQQEIGAQRSERNLATRPGAASQLVGSPFHESTLFRAANAFDKATPFRDQCSTLVAV
jgi:hypothetical protein